MKLFKRLQRFIRRTLLQSAFLINLDSKHQTQIIRLIRQIKKERDILMTLDECYHLLAIVKDIRKVNGDIAEVGVYRGGSSKIICEAKGNKTLYLFDTFDGLPETNPAIDIGLKKGEYKCSLEEIKDYLKSYKNVLFYKGLFQDNSRFIKDKKFSFVNLDIDLYSSTKDCLDFFYPRMQKGGIILSHDYNTKFNGVKKAFDEFFQDKSEIVIELSPTTQCLIVKLKKL